MGVNFFQNSLLDSVMIFWSSSVSISVSSLRAFCFLISVAQCIGLGGVCPIPFVFDLGFALEFLSGKAYFSQVVSCVRGVMLQFLAS